jgi:RIO kinase 1
MSARRGADDYGEDDGGEDHVEDVYEDYGYDDLAKGKAGSYAQPANASKKSQNQMEKALANSQKGTVKYQGKDDRATNEQVLDPRTRLILFKLINTGQLKEINGCISTGKEANVYHATNHDGVDFALKVYKTSILVFKDRERYVAGEFRFRNGYCKSNPRKMVATWAEKEMRNLKRLNAAGIPAPEPQALKFHVLLMAFIGKDGVAAPRLKEAQLSESRMREVYLQCVTHMRTMYQTCRLVHGDLSEYNMLYMQGVLYFIDVSQSVELDHPMASVFLRTDCKNVTHYFVQNGLTPMTTRELYHFVTEKDIVDVDLYLEEMQKEIQSRPEMSEMEAALQVRGVTRNRCIS